jgi:hypothetical protein
MTAVAAKTVLTGCLAPIDKGGLEQLIANGKANPNVIKTLKCKTVAEGKFRHANYIRNLPPYIVDEPPALLGDDTAPNPSEASLAALGSCIAVGLHAIAFHVDLDANVGEADRLLADVAGRQHLHPPGQSRGLRVSARTYPTSLRGALATKQSSSCRASGLGLPRRFAEGKAKGFP